MYVMFMQNAFMQVHGLLMDQLHILHKHRPEHKGLLIGIYIFIFPIDFP